MCTHEQVWAKVNVPEDRGAASLITALSSSQSCTIESCENINGSVWVTFVYGESNENPWQELTAGRDLRHRALPRPIGRPGCKMTR